MQKKLPTDEMTHCVDDEVERRRERRGRRMQGVRGGGEGQFLCSRSAHIRMTRYALFVVDSSSTDSQDHCARHNKSTGQFAPSCRAGPSEASRSKRTATTTREGAKTHSGPSQSTQTTSGGAFSAARSSGSTMSRCDRREEVGSRRRVASSAAGAGGESVAVIGACRRVKRIQQA